MLDSVNFSCFVLSRVKASIRVFLNVSLNSVTKIFVITVKGLEPATSSVRDWDATTATPEFTEFNGSCAQFRKNSIVMLWEIHLYISKHIQSIQWIMRPNFSYRATQEFFRHLRRTLMESALSEIGNNRLNFVQDKLAIDFHSERKGQIFKKCHGMTKSVKVHRKDQSVNKNAILASFVCFFNFPDRNLLILYKITRKLPLRVR